MRRIGKIGRFERLIQNRRHFSCDTENTLAIGTVCRNGNIKNPIVKTDNFLDILAHGCVLCQVKQAVYFRSGIEIVVDAKFFARAKHTEGFHAAKLALFNLFDPVGVLFKHRRITFHYRRIVERTGRFHTNVYVGRARDNLQFSAVLFTAIHNANLHVVAVGMGRKRLNLAYDYTVNLFAEIGKFFHLKTTGKKLFRKLLRRNIYVYVIF